MRALGLLVLGLVAFAVSLLAATPSTFILRNAEARSGKLLTAYDERGTLWNGSARLEMVVPGAIVPVERVEWHFKPARLLAARLAFDVVARIPGGEARAEVARTFTDWEAVGIEATGDAAVLAVLVPLVAPWRPEGRFEASSSRLTFDGRDIRGEARVTWRQAGLALSAVKPLGAYRVDIAAEGGPAKLSLTSLEGPLRLAGRGTLTLPGRLAFSGEARAEGPQAEVLEPALNAIGPRRADGSRAIEVRWN